MLHFQYRPRRPHALATAPPPPTHPFSLYTLFVFLISQPAPPHSSASVTVIPCINVVGLAAGARCAPTLDSKVLRGRVTKSGGRRIYVGDHQHGSFFPPKDTHTTWQDPNRGWKSNDTLVKVSESEAETNGKPRFPLKIQNLYQRWYSTVLGPRRPTIPPPHRLISLPPQARPGARPLHPRRHGRSRAAFDGGVESRLGHSERLGDRARRPRGALRAADAGDIRQALSLEDGLRQGPPHHAPPCFTMLHHASHRI